MYCTFHTDFYAKELWEKLPIRPAGKGAKSGGKRGADQTEVELSAEKKRHRISPSLEKDEKHEHKRVSVKKRLTSSMISQRLGRDERTQPPAARTRYAANCLINSLTRWANLTTNDANRYMLKYSADQFFFGA